MNKRTKLILIIASLLLLISIVLLVKKSFSMLFISHQIQIESIDNYSIPIPEVHKLLPLSEISRLEKNFETTEKKPVLETQDTDTIAKYSISTVEIEEKPELSPLEPPEHEIVPEKTEAQLIKDAKEKEQEPPPAPTEAEQKTINNGTSFIQFADITNNPETDTLTWSDSSSVKPASFLLSVQPEPFLFTEGNPFAIAKNYSLQLPEGSDGTQQKYSVNFPLSDRYKNQAYCLQAVLQDGKKDGNREFVYTMGMAQEIELDGIFDDWMDIPLLYRDTVENLQGPGPDWKEIKVARNKEYLYIYFTAAYPFAFIPTETYSRVMIMFDIDNNDTTGYQMDQPDFAAKDPKRFFGSEFLLTNGKLYKQENGVFNAGEIGSIQSGTNLLETAWKYEIGIPFSVLENDGNDLSNIRILFYSDGNMDYAPENRDSIILSLPNIQD